MEGFEMKKKGSLIWSLIMGLVLSLVAASAAPAAEKEDLYALHRSYTEHYPIEVFVVRNSPPGAPIQVKREKGDLTYEKFQLSEPATKPWHLGVLFPHIKDPWWIASNYGLMEEAKRMGVQVTLFEAGGYVNLERQMAQMEDLIAMGVDIIIPAPVSFEGFNAAIADAVKAGIPVLEACNDLSSEEVLSRVQASYWTMGYDAAQVIGEYSKAQGVTEVNTVLLPGPPGAGWTMDTKAGFIRSIDDVEKKHGVTINNLEVKWGDTDKAVQLPLVEDLVMTYGKKLDYIVGNALAAVAAIHVLQERGLSDKIKIISTYTTPEAADYLLRGKLFSMTNDRPTDQWVLSVDMAVDYLEGRRTKFVGPTKADFPDVIGPVMGRLTRERLLSGEYPLASGLPPKGYTPTFKYKP
jgi:protein TorT